MRLLLQAQKESGQKICVMHGKVHGKPENNTVKEFNKPGDQLTQFNCCSLEPREGLQHPCRTHEDDLLFVDDQRRWRTAICRAEPVYRGKSPGLSCQILPIWSFIFFQFSQSSQ